MWLTRNGTSPLTNLDLRHRTILRLSSAKDMLDEFLCLCSQQADAHRSKLEDIATSHPENWGGRTDLLDAMNQIVAYVQRCNTEIDRWRNLDFGGEPLHFGRLPMTRGPALALHFTVLDLQNL